MDIVMYARLYDPPTSKGTGRCGCAASSCACDHLEAQGQDKVGAWSAWHLREVEPLIGALIEPGPLGAQSFPASTDSVDRPRNLPSGRAIADASVMRP